MSAPRVIGDAAVTSWGPVYGEAGMDWVGPGTSVPTYQAYGCTERGCPAALAMGTWPVEVLSDGTASDEEDTVCPECYSQGHPVVSVG